MAVRQYLGVAERGDEGWWISFPVFPGLTSAGNTLAELAGNARDALATAIEAMQEDGEVIPAGVEDDPTGGDYDPSGYRDARAMLVPVEVGGKSLRINVTMDEGLVSRLDDLGRRTGTTRSALLARGARLVLTAGEAA